MRAGLVPDLDSLGRFPWCGHPVLFGKRKCTDYVLAFFGDTKSAARGLYLEFMQAGSTEGRKPHLVGGGLIRSSGGWEEIKKQGRESLMKGDERILGDTSFVLACLADAEDRLERRYALKQSGIDLAAVEQRAASLLGMRSEDISRQGREKRLVDFRSLICFFAVRELGLSLTALADRFGITSPAISYAVRRGEKMVREKGFTLLQK